LLLQRLQHLLQQKYFDFNFDWQVPWHQVLREVMVQLVGMQIDRFAPGAIAILQRYCASAH
jgi:hypothetical protein